MEVLAKRGKKIKEYLRIIHGFSKLLLLTMSERARWIVPFFVHILRHIGQYSRVGKRVGFGLSVNLGSVS